MPSISPSSPCCPASNPSALPFHAGMSAALTAERHGRQHSADQKLIYFFVMHCDIHRD